MAHSPGKFCLDGNLVRWSLLNGVITRKNKDDEPLAGKELPVRDITGIEKVTITKKRRLPFGWHGVVIGVALLALCIWISNLPGRAVTGLIGIALLYWGAKRIPAITTVHEGYRIVAPGLSAEEWVVVGSMPEVLGFIEAVRSEIRQKNEAVRA